MTIGTDSNFGFTAGPIQTRLPNPQSLNPLSVASISAAQIHNAKGSSFPWQNSKTLVQSAFFSFFKPDGTLWNKLLPYRLIVWDTGANKGKGGVVGGTITPTVQVTALPGESVSTLSITPIDDSQWIFNLPITPQQLNITDNYAINTSATLRGILEEHSGVRFKNISIQGTFGVWPNRHSIITPPGSPASALTSGLQSLFGGTIAAAQNVATQFSSVVSALTGNANKPKTVSPGDPGDQGNGLQLTGYYQAIALQQFLEQYAEAKKNPVNASWRLVFDIPKQKQSFVVSPVAFTWNENVNKPMEINYNLQLKAWRRIDLNNYFANTPSTLIPITPGVLQQILGTITAAQNTAAASAALIGSVRSDVDNILNIIRQTGLFVKDLAGVAIAASDLPSQLINDASSTITQFMSTLTLNNLTGAGATNGGVLGAIKALKASVGDNEGLSPQNFAGSQPGPVKPHIGGRMRVTSSPISPASVVDPAYNIFVKPQLNPMLFSQVPVNSLKLNSKQQAALENEVDTVNSFSVAQLKAMRGTILTMVTQLESSFGAGNQYYSKIYNTPFTPNTSNQVITLDQYSILQTFYELLQSYDILTATQQLDSQDTLNNMEYVQSLAQASGIPFSIPNSKVQQPVPFGLDMEGIALRYLGDAQRWLEIATLNNLVEPYIDQTGFVYNLLSNADGRNIVIGDSTNLVVGQLVSINSSVQSPTTRTILDIVTLSQTSFLLTLDGDANLEIYKIADGAYLKAYLPGTVNSSNVIFIPSDLQTPAYDQISIPTSVANVDLVALSKVDWLLQPNSNGSGADLAVTNTGDFRLAAGIPNLVQALTTTMSSVAGTSYANPTFGAAVKPGSSIADFKAQDIYNSITNAITSDPRFSGITGLQINQQGPSLSINLAVGIAGVAGVFPIGFQLGNQLANQ